MAYRTFGALALLILVFLLSACGTDAAATATPIPLPTATFAPTSTPFPTDTPLPPTDIPPTSSLVGSSVPPYPNGGSLNLSADVQKQLVASLAGNIGDARYDVFHTADAPDKVSAFYSTALTASGYNLIIQPGSDTSIMGMVARVQVYNKGTTDATTVVTLGPLDATTTGLLAVALPSVGNQINVNDTLIIIATGKIK